ncbi:hypothetical protein F4779DRAFT_621105 [Xylariaceae sp. FL0662B]|nr:hypothetical protein F4779DRAFT_621105 [Xylariaceae sp. FL0662B]
MPGPSASKAASRAKARGLVINTDVPREGLTYKYADGESFSQLVTAPPRKQEFEATAKRSPAPKLSEALKNTDWRNNRRRRDDIAEPFAFGCLPTAPPEKLVFADDEGKKPKKKLRIDTSVANGYGVRRYRDTPIDPDLIRSAPATKQEYDDVEDESEHECGVENDELDGVETFQVPPSVNEKPLIRLQAFTPTTRDSFEKILAWGPESEQTTDGSWSSGMSPLTQVTPIDPKDNSYAEVNFPLAAIRAVKNAKRLRIKGWDDIDEDVKKNLAQLEVPRTAGLPVDKLRIEYEKAKDALARKGVLEDPAIQSLQLEGCRRKTDFSSKAAFQREVEADQARFDALLDKLNKSAAPRLRARSIIDIKPPHWTRDSERQHKDSSEGTSEGTSGESSQKTGGSSDAQSMPRKTSHDSGVSGVRDDESTKKGATILNPKAAEFNFSSFNPMAGNSLSANQDQPKHNDIIYDGLPSAARVPSNSNTDLKAMIARMNERMNDLEAELALAKAQASGSQDSVSSAEKNLIQSITNQLHLNPAQNGQVQQQAPTLPGAGHDFVAHKHSASSFGLPQHFHNFSPSFQPAGLPANGAPSVAPQDHPQHTGGGFLIMPPAAFNPMPGHYFQPSPLLGLQMGPQAPVTKPQTENRPAGSGPTPAYMNNPFGPKPVRKPKGPFRAGDMQQAQRQQEYEAYLEYKRATDPDYANQCRQRQARRAERHRSRNSTSDEAAESGAKTNA